MVGFYPLSDLYGAGKKTLILSGSRFKWLWSKYIWTVINVIMYYAAMILVTCGCDMCNREVEHKA